MRISTKKEPTNKVDSFDERTPTITAGYAQTCDGFHTDS